MKPQQAENFQRSSSGCYNCGKHGHRAVQCNDKTKNRMQICWTCGQNDHIRTSERCPGNPNPKNWFCSYCKTKGISTELCKCNNVRTRVTMKRNQAKTSEKEIKKEWETPAKKQKTHPELSSKPGDTQLIVKINNSRMTIPSYDWLWAIKVQIGGNSYIAQISPGRNSFINPERVPINSVIDVPTTIYNITRNIYYTRDTTIPTPVVLGDEAIIIFGISAFIEDEQTLPFAALKGPENNSDEESIKKPHPNRRLEYED